MDIGIQPPDDPARKVWLCSMVVLASVQVAQHELRNYPERYDARTHDTSVWVTQHQKDIEQLITYQEALERGDMQPEEILGFFEQLAISDLDAVPIQVSDETAERYITRVLREGYEIRRHSSIFPKSKKRS